MDKIWLIIKREYATRVMKKSFILITLLTPLGIGLIAFIAGYLASNATSSEKKVRVVDQTGMIGEGDLNSKSLTYVLSPGDISELKKTYQEDGYDILVEVPKQVDTNYVDVKVNYFAKDKLSVMTISSMERKIEKAIRNYKLDNSSIPRAEIDKLEVNVGMENALANSDNEDGVKGDTSSKFSSQIATGLSYLMGFLMYMVIFIFGSMVMRSVMEEKINRIVEVMISSVKPFQLLLGKVIGVGLVGLTQLGIWLILIPLISIAASAFFGADMTTGMTPETTEAMEAMKEMGTAENSPFAAFMTELMALNWALIIPAFIVFFFGGYFIYSALFAAVGSAIGDDLQEGQQMMLPVTIPVILAFVMIPAVFNDPDGPIAIFGSMFPLTSPIVMPARLPFDPPVWQVLLSIGILILGIVGVTWLAARIYRVGIFMYGKKVSFRELAKWVTYKG